jgi:hypothetical protein
MTRCPTIRPRHPVIVEHQVADLAAHLPHAVSSDLRTLALGRVAARETARPQLEVGHVDLHDAVHAGEALRLSYPLVS